MIPVNLIVGDITYDGYLNDTIAAKDFAKRLPFTVTCKKCDTEYYANSANGIFDPLDIRKGFQTGDIMQWNGYFSIAFRDSNAQENAQYSMIIGRLKNPKLFSHTAEKIKITLQNNEQGGSEMKYQSRKEFEKIDSFGVGAPNDAYAQYFKGHSFLKPLTEFGKSPVFLANVSFEPGCRNNWHIHHASSGGGQILICTAGEGWYQEEGKEAVSLTAGSVITIPAEVKHWHGAKKDSWFSHIAVEVPGENCSNEWCEPVSDEEYGKL